jgi:hypothetical protein
MITQAGMNRIREDSSRMDLDRGKRKHTALAVVWKEEIIGLAGCQKPVNADRDSESGQRFKS